MNNEIINTCYIALQATPSIKIIASYSHVIPTILSLTLGMFVFFKAKFNFFSRVFLIFIVVFSLWLIGDFIAWTSNDYNLVYTTWSLLDYLEIIFYVLGLYFAIVFVRKSDIHFVFKTILFLLTVPAFLLTVSQQSVVGFDQPICEAFNNEFLGNYKIIVEGIILSIILIYAINPFFRKLSWREIRPKLVVLGSMFLFLSTFSITEYLASTTGYYEMNLYSLFLLPILLVAIIYSVFELDIFNVKVLGSHYLVVGLIILMGGQLFFITNNTNRLLTIIAILMAGGLSIILFRNIKRESDQRVQIAKLNIKLQESMKQRESLVHLVTHKVKGSFTRSKYIFAGLLDGTFGEITPEVKKFAEQGLESDNMGIETVDLVLNSANMQKGLVKYDMKKIDLKDIVVNCLSEKKGPAEKKGLGLDSNIKPARNASGIADAGGDDNYYVLGDVFWLKETVNNLIENSLKYTKQGKITVGLEKNNGKIKLSVQDTGVGITEEDKKRLFTEGGRGQESVKINVDSTGYGLYTVKLVVEAHKGRVWAESEGANKGSTFFVELPTAQ